VNNKLIYVDETMGEIRKLFDIREWTMLRIGETRDRIDSDIDEKFEE
jgi:hypothetical protein